MVSILLYLSKEKLRSKISYYQFVVTLQISQAITILVALLLRMSSRKVSILYLLLFMMNIVFVSIVIFLYLEVGVATVLRLRGFNTLSFLALGPLLFMYVKSSLIPNYRTSTKDLVHVGPFFIGFLSILPFAIQSFNDRFYDFYGPFDFKALTMARLLTNIFVAFYLVKTFIFIQKHQGYMRQVLANNIKYGLRWVYLLIGIVGAMWMLSSFILIFGVNHFVATLALELCVVSFFVIAIYSHVFSHILFLTPEDEQLLVRIYEYEMGENLLPQSTNMQEPKKSNGSNGEKYKTSPLTPDQLTENLALLEHLIESRGEVFYRPTLQLSDLAKELGIPNYLASQVINEGLQKNFYDLVNEQRVKKAQQILSDKNRQNEPVINIAYEVGYNSKSTFNASFKKYSGMTPTQYRRFNLDK